MFSSLVHIGRWVKIESDTIFTHTRAFFRPTCHVSTLHINIFICVYKLRFICPNAYLRSLRVGMQMSVRQTWRAVYKHTYLNNMMRIMYVFVFKNTVGRSYHNRWYREKKTANVCHVMLWLHFVTKTFVFNAERGT